MAMPRSFGLPPWPFTVGMIAIAVLLLALLGIRANLPPPDRTPSVIGVIVSEENVSGVWRFELRGGNTVEIDFDETITLPDATGGGPGAILFYGAGSQPWYFTIREPFPGEDDHRFHDAARDDGTHVVFSNGLRLPKAATFDGRGWPQDGRYDLALGGPTFAPFCINQNGQVTTYLAMPSDQREGCPKRAPVVGSLGTRTP